MSEVGGTIRTWLKRLGLLLACATVLVVVLVAVGVVFAPDFTTRKTPAGYAVNTIRYLTLDTQSKVFISVWLPPGLTAGQRIPTLIRTERYADQFETGWLGKVMQFYTGEGDNNHDGARLLLDAGYAFVLAQSPGSCQSSGPRPAEYPPQEVDAMGLAIDWIVQQPWSNQRVGAYGGSLLGHHGRDGLCDLALAPAGRLPVQTRLRPLHRCGPAGRTGLQCLHTDLERHDPGDGRQ